MADFFRSGNDPKARSWIPLLFGLFFFVLGMPFGVCLGGDPRLELRDVDTGREILSAVLPDGEQVVLTWKNSLYGLQVTEVFEVRSGTLYLTQVTHASASGPPPPFVSPEEVEELYQAGVPFTARGLAKPFRKVIFRVAEVGEPKMKIRDRLVDFKEETGFGGRIALMVKSADSP